MLASTLRCSRCPAVALLALSLLIGWSEQAAVQHLHRVLSPPLVDEDTYVAVDEVAKQAQREQDDPSVRLLPNIKPNQETRDLEICCIHANILDFYLNNVLPHHSSNNAHAHRLQTDLSRISQDLETHGCVSVLLLLCVSLSMLASQRAGRFRFNASVASIFSFDLKFKSFLLCQDLASQSLMM
uniref:Interleukin-24-like n=1 Tax=Takifugu rubripes TaxID=31033 RepID=A0A674MFU6_TAKRU